MGKRTRFGVGTVLGVFACLSVGTAAAAPPSVNVGTASGAPGSKVSFPVTLALNGTSFTPPNGVAGTQNDIAFDSSTPIAVKSGSYCALTTSTACTTSANCPVYPPPFDHEACINGKCAIATGTSCTLATYATDCPVQREACVPNTSGAPDCTVSPAIGKDGFFAFTPNGCSGAACTGISAIIVAVDNLTAISDNAQLYSCKVNIASGASGSHTLTVSNVVMGDTSGNPIAGVTGNNGTVTVAAGCCGDSTADGSISTAEATNAILALVNRTPETDPAAQCTSAGTVTTADATKVILNLVNRTCNP